MTKKIGWDERGIAHVLLMLLGVIVIAGVAFAGYKVANKKTDNSTNTNTSSNSSSSSSTGSSTSVEATCLAAYHDANLCHFASSASSFDKTAYTATLSLVQNGGTNSTTTLKNDGKGNTSLTGSGGGQVINAITLDGVEYVQSNNTGPWVEYPSGATAPTSNPTSNMDISVVGSTTTTFKSLGKEACGSLDCYKYEIDSKLTPDTKQIVWFDTSSYKLREWNYADNSGDSTDMKITYGSVNITKPSPVETLSQMEGGLSGGSSTTN